MKKYGNLAWKAAGTLAGAAAGYLYWRESGCLSGHCPIQSNAGAMTLWAGAMGYLLADLLQPMLTRTTDKENPGRQPLPK
jgi:hypothetical protein